MVTEQETIPFPHLMVHDVNVYFGWHLKLEHVDFKFSALEQSKIGIPWRTVWGAVHDHVKENPQLRDFLLEQPRVHLALQEWHSLATAEPYFQLLLAGMSTLMWRQPCQVWISPGHLPMPLKVTQAPHRARNKRMVAETTATPRLRNNSNLASNFDRSSSGTDAPLAISSMWCQIEMNFLTSSNFKTIMKKLSATDRMGIIGMDGAWTLLMTKTHDCRLSWMPFSRR